MAAVQPKTYGVRLADSALAFSTPGVTPSKFLQQKASEVWGAIKRGVKSVLEFGSRVLEGGKELLAAIGRGDWQIFVDWAKNDPFGFLAGGAAVAIGGWFLASVSGLTALAAGGISSLWATLGSIKIGGFTLGLALPSLQQALLGGTNVILNTDWLQSDKAILASLNSTYLAFLNNVGESTGRLLMAFAFGGGKANPKLTLNVTASASLIIMARQQGSEIEEELVEELAQVANAFLRYATNLAGKLGYLQIRKWARENFRTGFEPLDRQIKSWGLQEGQSFSIAQKIEDRVEKLQETDPALGNFVEGLLEGIGDGFSDFIVMV